MQLCETGSIDTKQRMHQGAKQSCEATPVFGLIIVRGEDLWVRQHVESREEMEDNGVLHNDTAATGQVKSISGRQSVMAKKENLIGPVHRYAYEKASGVENWNGY